MLTSEKKNTPPLDHQSLAAIENTSPPDWNSLLCQLASIPVGRYDATNYEQSIEKIFSAAMYPALTNPQPQQRIHEGRKRIDITYVNIATDGFFCWLASHYPASHVHIECKNYGREIGNPELDQLSSRFSPSRGQFGILSCRSFIDKELFIQRCKDTANDGRGFIIPLDDGDLHELVDILKSRDTSSEFSFFKNKFNRLIM